MKRILCLTIALVFTVLPLAQAQASPIGIRPETSSNSPVQKQAASLGFTQLKTGFGYVRITNVKRPAKYKWSSASIAVDIRNMSKLGWAGLSIELLDDFDNRVGFSYVFTSDYKTDTMKKNGVYKTKMNICAKNHKWTLSGFAEEYVSAISKANRYSLVVEDYLGGDRWGTATYTLRR